MEKNKSKSTGFWGKLNEPVKPTVAWSVYGGVLAVSIVLALISWL